MVLGQTSRLRRKPSYAGRTGSSFEKLHVQMRPSSPSKELQPTPRVQSASSSARAPVPRRVGSTGLMSDGAHGMVQDAQTVSATHRGPGARTFAPAPAQHDIPIDGLLSFTLPCAIQNTCCLLAALWLRDQQKHSSHVGTVETLGAGSSGTASEGARIAYPSRPLGTNHERKGCHLGGDAGATGLGGLTSASVARRRGFSALADAACCAASKGSAGGSGEIATNASVQQYRDVGVPRNSQQQLSMSHHLPTVINSTRFPTRPTLHNLHDFAARFSSNNSLFAPLRLMSSWRSPTALQSARRLQDRVSAAH